MSILKAPDPTLFKRPYSARRKRNAAKRRPISPVSKLLLRVLAVLLTVVSATVAVVFNDSAPRPVAAGSPQPPAPLKALR